MDFSEFPLKRHRIISQYMGNYMRFLDLRGGFRYLDSDQ